MISKPRLTIILVVLLAVFSIFLSLAKGSTPTYFSSAIWLKLRFPRTIAAFVSGSLLALAGSLMQLLLQNPLADPYALGISGGAALFTLLLMLLGVSEYWLIGGAWLGSLITIVLILLLALKHRWQSYTLLLSGVALACGFSACISVILLLSPASNLHSMLFWLSGDLNGAQFPWLGLGVLGLGTIVSWWLAPELNLLTRGDREARALGLTTERYKLALYLLSSLLTATAVTLAGCIGFIGLIIPHIARWLVGYNHRLNLPVTLLLGGSLLTLADTLSRIVFAPQQIPVGIVMAIIGVPVFVALLR